MVFNFQPRYKSYATPKPKLNSSSIFLRLIADITIIEIIILIKPKIKTKIPKINVSILELYSKIQ